MKSSISVERASQSSRLAEIRARAAQNGGINGSIMQLVSDRAHLLALIDDLEQRLEAAQAALEASKP